MANLGQLRVDLARTLGEINTDFWTADDRLAFINNALRDVHNLLKPVRDLVNNVTGLGLTTYLPSNFMELCGGTVSWTADGSTELRQLRRMGVVELDTIFGNEWRTNPGGQLPTYYYTEVINNQPPLIVLAPTPLTAGTIRFEYLTTVTPLVNDSDEPWGGKFAEHHYVLVDLAEVYARRMEQNPQAEALAQQRYERGVGLMSIALQHRGGEPDRRRLRPSNYRRH